MSMPWALVYTTSSVTHARIIEGYLESYDVPARVLSAADSSRALTVGSLAIVKVFVPADLAVNAEKLLREMDIEAESVNDEDYPETYGED